MYPQARWHFYGGSGGESGAVVLARKEVARQAWRARGAPLSDAQAATLLATLRADPDVLRPGVCVQAWRVHVHVHVHVHVRVRVRVRVHVHVVEAVTPIP